MAIASVPVDLFNPGQVFGCLGLVEIAEILLGRTQAAFDWSDPGQSRFLLRCEGDADPISAGLEFLADAEVRAMTPVESGLSTESWGIPCEAIGAGDPFPSNPPTSPAPLPATLSASGHVVMLSSWGEARMRDVLVTGRDNVKFWGGAAGYPAVALLRDALDAVRPLISTARSDPFAVSAPQKSSFRFDWRRDYIPIEIGFSLNAHGGAVQPRGYPLVEVLAAVGLSHARPDRVRKLEYRYGVAGRSDPGQPELEAMVPAAFLRAVLGSAALPLPIRTFVMNLDWPGQENQARCITTVLEETA